MYQKHLVLFLTLCFLPYSKAILGDKKKYTFVFQKTNEGPGKNSQDIELDPNWSIQKAIQHIGEKDSRAWPGRAQDIYSKLNSKYAINKSMTINALMQENKSKYGTNDTFYIIYDDNKKFAFNFYFNNKIIEKQKRNDLNHRGYIGTIESKIKKKVDKKHKKYSISYKFRNKTYQKLDGPALTNTLKSILKRKESSWPQTCRIDAIITFKNAKGSNTSENDEGDGTFEKYIVPAGIILLAAAVVVGTICLAKKKKKKTKKQDLFTATKEKIYDWWNQKR